MGTTRVRPHAFVEDPELVDPYVPAARRERGPRRWCARCGLPGERGDDRHPISAELAETRANLVRADASALAARIIGENERRTTPPPGS